MKRFIQPFVFFVFVLAACAPAAAVPTFPAFTPTISTEAALSPQAQPTSTQLASATSKPQGKKATPAPSSQNQPAATPKPKGKNPTQAPVASTSSSFIAAPILGRPTDTSVTVNVVPAAAMEIYYEYGTAPGIYTIRTIPQTAAASQPLETLINDLQPNTTYFYRICYSGNVGPESTFVTQRAPGSSFTFDIQGDSHPERVNKEFDPALYTKTLLSAAADHPDFYMTIGDDFSVDQLKTVNPETVTALYINQRSYLGQVGAPVFLVNGNHEQASLANLNGTANNVAVWAQTARNAYFPEPAPDNFYSGDSQSVDSIGLLRDYYAFTWGDALFVVIDPYWHSTVTVDNAFGADHGQKANRDLWNVTLGGAQYQWFEHTLETSTARYKFVFTHHVLGTGRGGIELAGSYEWGDAAGLVAHRPGWDKTIQQLMADNHVSIFFQGHDHIFAHQELDGVVYQTLPEPADPNYSLFNADAYLSGDKLPNSGHVRVSVSPEGVKVEYVRSFLNQPDQLAYSYTVK